MIETLSYYSAALAVMVIIVNIITQVIKGFTYDKLPTRVVAVIVSIILSVVSVFAWCAIKNISVLWYYIVGSIVLGFIAAYGAMYGYDNLYGEFWEAIKKILGGGENGLH